MIWLLVGYMWLFIHRPFEVWPALGELRIEFVYMCIVGTVWLACPKKRFVPNVMHLALSVFALSLLVCVMLSPWSDSCIDTIDTYFKFLVFYLLLVSVVHDERDFRFLILAYLVITSLYMVHSLWEYKNGRHVARMGIVRMVGVDSSFGDPNAFGSSIVLSLVFIPAVWSAWPSRYVRAFLVGFMMLAGLCVSLTGSRGSFVCLAVWAMVLAARNRWRWRLFAVGCFCVPILFLALPSSLQTRFETIVFPEIGPKNAQKSADTRILGLLKGVQLFEEHPVSGIGPGAWRAATGWKLQSHNLYGQLLGEMGALGVISFGAILFAFGVNLFRVYSVYRQYPEQKDGFLHALSFAIFFALILLLFQGNFGHNLYRYHWVWFGAFLSIAHHCILQRLHASSGHRRPLPRLTLTAVPDPSARV